MSLGIRPAAEWVCHSPIHTARWSTHAPPQLVGDDRRGLVRAHTEVCQVLAEVEVAAQRHAPPCVAAHVKQTATRDAAVLQPGRLVRVADATHDCARDVAARASLGVRRRIEELRGVAELDEEVIGRQTREELGDDVFAADVGVVTQVPLPC